MIEIKRIIGENQRRRIFWHIPLTILIIKLSSDIRESDYYFKTLISFLDGQSSEFDSNNLLNLRFLAPESVKKYLRFFEGIDVKLEMFKLAPESLKRDQIKYLLRNPQLWEFMFMYASNFQKLCTLVDFSAYDLLHFFPVTNCNYHLELHEALYTARSTALVGYLNGIQGALNFPENSSFQFIHVLGTIWNLLI